MASRSSLHVSSGVAARTTRPKIAVVSPFIDQMHGTEIYVSEWLSRLADQFELHVYSQHVEGLDLSRVSWHRIPKLGGPHVFNYIWWFAANHFRRVWDSRVRGFRVDLTYSPGINCLDADLVSVHIVFAELMRRKQQVQASSQSSARLRQFHRQTYYRLIRSLESRVYRREKTRLIPITKKTVDSVRQVYGRSCSFPPIYFGIDTERFNPAARLLTRDSTRKRLGFNAGDLVLLLIGNGWRNKGLDTLLDAMKLLGDARLHLIVVGKDDPRPFQSKIREYALSDCVHFPQVRPDVEIFYAAADIYTAPSHEDALPLPVAEAMACGLPAVVSNGCGISEIITHGQNAFLLNDASSGEELAAKIRALYDDRELCERIGQNASRLAAQYSWSKNARQFAECLLQVLEEKRASALALEKGV